MATITRMRALLLLVPLLAGCTPPATDSGKGDSSIVTTGTIENPAIDEASGLARSQRQDDVFWVINDDGPALLHAIDGKGADLGRVKISKTDNRDWEDLASFSLDGEPYLLIAEIGDNEARRDKVTLYVVEEPKFGDSKVKVEWDIDFTYPDGPRDAEAVAVDVENNRVLVLTKRDIPAQLYEVGLTPAKGVQQQARLLGTVASLPQPRQRDVEYAPKTNDYYWQPTAMDLSADGNGAVILTYGGVFHYRKSPGERWIDAFRRQPAVLGRTRNREAESVAFTAGGDAVFVTVEQRNAPLIRFDLNVSAAPVPAVTLMTFNVQNLFDNTDDPDKDDKAYLPIAAKQSAAHIAACNDIDVETWRDECLNLDWSDAAIDHKLGVVAQAILQVNDGRGADIIALQEIENLAILERLREEHLAGRGYAPAILIEGTDNRGVDVAFLSRLPVVGKPTLHPLILEDFPDRAGDTRGLLEATFELPDGSLLTGFSVHFPAPFHPTAMRVLAYNHLNAVRNEVAAEHSVFAAGDFNTSSREDSEHGMLERFVRPFWRVAHDACAGCPGTQYYAREDSWSFLDMILFSPARGGKATWKIRADSVWIPNSAQGQTTPAGIPNRYKAREGTGVSDHWPLAATIELAEKQ